MSQQSLKVLSYNIHKGFSHFNTHYLLDNIRDVVRAVDADLVFLQEVIGENVKHRRRINNWVPETQFEFLADSVWPFHAYGKNAIYSHGHHGNAVLSKTPFQVLGNIELSQFSISRRGMLMGETKTGIYVLCVHLGLFAWERRRQLQIIIDEIESRIDPGAPLILAGDFNDWHMQVHRILDKRLGLQEAYLSRHQRVARTFPVGLPLLKMDRIYYRNMDAVNALCFSGTPWSRLSDHCALYAEFSLSL